jgi:hypothetical protein
MVKLLINSKFKIIKLSSSLDDREPYEFFQDELDEFLFIYIKEKKVFKKEIKLLNQFIEFACVEKGVAKIDELSLDITLDFIHYLEVGMNNLNKEETAITIDHFLVFIKNESEK